MSTHRDAIKAYRDATLLLHGGDEIRVRLSTDKAVALAKEMSDDEITHVAQVRSAVEVMDSLLAAGQPEGLEDSFKYYTEFAKFAQLFWDGFNGQVVDGVEIVRAA